VRRISLRRAAQIDSELAALAPEEHVPLATAIDRYLAFYRIWATELVPLIRAARRELSPDLLLGARPSAVELTLLAAARGELDADAVVRRLGLLSPAWDVAVPTFAEQPALLDGAVARARIALESIPSEEPVSTPGSAANELARAAADLAERDDVWFARAQWQVRRAILARARELGLDPDDAFWIPLEELATATVTIDVDDTRRRAGAARAAAGRTVAWEMPLVVGRRTTDLDDRPPLVGIGSGGCASGRVVRLASLASAVIVGPTDVVVTRAVTPALAVIVVGCAAIVSESGGLLDHGAAMARELGIPCIVGCRDAWSRLSDGMLVTIDGDAGTVTC
jgi:pyruvate,water dikinase